MEARNRRIACAKSSCHEMCKLVGAYRWRGSISTVRAASAAVYGGPEWSAASSGAAAAAVASAPRDRPPNGRQECRLYPVFANFILIIIQFTLTIIPNQNYKSSHPNSHRLNRGNNSFKYNNVLYRLFSRAWVSKFRKHK